MKTFSLLWLDNAGGNVEVTSTDADTGAQAAEKFGMSAEFVKHANGGAHCVVEIFNPLGI